MRRLVKIALVAVAAGCGSPTGPVRSSSPADVQLRIGQSAEVDGRLWVRFVAVPSDSRCPAAADCVWVGDAEVAIALSLDGGAAAPDTLHTMPGSSALTTTAYVVSLVALTPYPQTTAPIPADQYEARLHLVGLGTLTSTAAASPRR